MALSRAGSSLGGRSYRICSSINARPVAPRLRCSIRPVLKDAVIFQQNSWYRTVVASAAAPAEGDSTAVTDAVEASATSLAPTTAALQADMSRAGGKPAEEDSESSSSCDSSSDSDSDSDSDSSEDEKEGPCDCGSEQVLDKAARAQLMEEKKKHKEDIKAEIKQLKALEKADKEQLKAEKKAHKMDLKAEKKKLKAQVKETIAAMDDCSSSDSDSSSSDSDSDSDSGSDQ